MAQTDFKQNKVKVKLKLVKRDIWTFCEDGSEIELNDYDVTGYEAALHFLNRSQERISKSLRDQAGI